MLIELHQNVLQWTTKYKTLGQTLVRHPACGAFFSSLFVSPLKVPSDSLFEPAVIDGRCALDRARIGWPRANAVAIRLFHIDKQGKKCHLQHLEIDVVRLITSKCAWRPIL